MNFENPFFSLAGQKERLSNAISTVYAAVNPFDDTRVKADTGSKTVNKALEAAANNPYTTAAVVAAAPYIASTASSSVAAASTGKQVAIAGGTFLGSGILATSEKARVKTIGAVESVTPENLFSTGRNIGKVIESPTKENASELWKENKGTLAALGVAAVAIGGAATAGTIATISNTQAVKQNTQAAGFDYDKFASALQAKDEAFYQKALKQQQDEWGSQQANAFYKSYGQYPYVATGNAVSPVSSTPSNLTTPVATIPKTKRKVTTKKKKRKVTKKKPTKRKVTKKKPTKRKVYKRKPTKKRK